MYVCMNVYMYVCMYVYMYVCMVCVCMHTFNIRKPIIISFRDWETAQAFYNTCSPSSYEVGMTHSGMMPSGHDINS